MLARLGELTATELDALFDALVVFINLGCPKPSPQAVLDILDTSRDFKDNEPFMYLCYLLLKEVAEDRISRPDAL